jgi:hypothetical protein
MFKVEGTADEVTFYSHNIFPAPYSVQAVLPGQILFDIQTML